MAGPEGCSSCPNVHSGQLALERGHGSAVVALCLTAIHGAVNK